MSRDTQPTLLSLNNYARWLGLDPLHFAGGFSDLRPGGSCNDIWLQYDWQDGNKASRHQLAGLIAKAEEDIALYAGYWPAVVWVSDEWQPYPRPHRRGLYGTGYTQRGDHKPMNAKWGYVWYGGQRATDFLAVDNWDALDADGDGYPEWVVFTMPGMDADLNPCEVRAYFKEYLEVDKVNCRTDPNSAGADPAWEVRPAFASMDGTTLTVRIPKWCLFKPHLQEALDATGIDADDVASYVDELLFYREYNDPSGQAQFLWGEPGCQTAACAKAVQTGCLDVRDPRSGIMVPQPGTYDADSGTFTYTSWTEGREPDSVRFWYRAGYQPEVAPGCDPLSGYWANLIAILATARLERPLCACSAAQSKADQWRADITYAGEHSFQLGMDALECPLGHRRGEVHVWKHLTGRPGLIKGKAVRL